MVTEVLGIVFVAIVCLACVVYAEPIKVAVIDTGYSGVQSPKLCKTGHFDYTKNTPTIGFDSIPDKHGTVMANIIAETAGDTDYCIIIYKINLDSNNQFQLALSSAIINNYEFINLSMEQNWRLAKEERIYKVNDYSIFVVAAGNKGTDLDKNCNNYPTCYKLPRTFTVMGHKQYDEDELDERSNYTKKLPSLTENFCYTGGEYKDYCGTSVSTAIATGKLVKEWLGVKRIKDRKPNYIDNVKKEKKGN